MTLLLLSVAALVVMLVSTALMRSGIQWMRIADTLRGAPRWALFERARLRDSELGEATGDIRALLGIPGFQGPLCGEFIDGDRFFRLSAPLIYQSVQRWPLRDGSGHRQVFTIEAGFRCDLESVVKWAMPFTVSAKCGVLHDHLFDTGLLPFGAANAIYREALGFQQVPGWRAYARWLGVTVGGWPAWVRYRLRDEHNRVDL